MRTISVSAFLLVTVSTAGAQGRACPRPPAKQFKPGDTVVVTQPATMPCRMQVVDTPIELRVDENGVVANIGTQVLRLSDGRFISSTGRAEVSVWGADGKFVKNIGRQGQGPGEFAPGGMTFHEGPGGALYVRDNNLRWSVFSPALEFVRTHSAVGIGFDWKQSVFLDDGRFLSATNIGPPGGTFFSVYDFAKEAAPAAQGGGRAAPAGFGPAKVAQFADIPEPERRLASYGRMIAYAGGATFWAGPLPRAQKGYVLELWSVDGMKLRTLRRDAPWFVAGSDAEPPRLPEGQGFGAPPVTQIIQMHADTTGLLFVLVGAATGKWKPTSRADTAAYRVNEESAYELYFEVIDTRAGAVLASVGPLRRTEALAQIPAQMFRSTRQGYRIGEAPDGLPLRRIVDVRLLAR